VTTDVVDKSIDDVLDDVNIVKMTLSMMQL